MKTQRTNESSRTSSENGRHRHEKHPALWNRVRMSGPSTTVLDCISQYDNTMGIKIQEIIRKELLWRGWSQRELCRRTGLLPHQLCQYLNGNRDIYAETLQRILDALELQILPASRRRKGR